MNTQYARCNDKNEKKKKIKNVLLSQDSLHVQYEYLMLIITRSAWDRQVCALGRVTRKISVNSVQTAIVSCSLRCISAVWVSKTVQLVAMCSNKSLYKDSVLQ